MVATKSERNQPAVAPTVTWYQRLPELSGDWRSAVACVPWFKVVSRALEALAAARRFTPRGSLTQTGNGSAGAASGTVPGDFGIGSEAGHEA